MVRTPAAAHEAGAVGPVALLVPVKAFADAKVRLAPALPAADRRRLARDMGARVLAAAHRLPRFVACDDDEVAAWAVEHGATVVWTAGMGLDGAVEAGCAQLHRAGVRQVVVAHADLPLATDLTWLARFPGVTLVPDRHHDGTNVACVPAAVGFRFRYGPGSFGRHLDEARRLGLDVRIARTPELAWDVDLPADLVALATSP